MFHEWEILASSFLPLAVYGSFSELAVGVFGFARLVQLGFGQRRPRGSFARVALGALLRRGDLAREARAARAVRFR